MYSKHTLHSGVDIAVSFSRMTSAVLSVCLLCLASLSVHAEDKVILTVINGSVSGEYSLKQLDTFPQHTYKTKTPWTGEHLFSGPLLRDVMQQSGWLHSRTLKAHALNDYIVDIDPHLLSTYSVLLATRMDGKVMRIRNKGPIWIVFPLDQSPELDTIDVHSQMVWQLNKLESY